MHIPRESSPVRPFYIIDFDRTLADSEKLFEVFVEIAQQFTPIPEDQITSAHEQMIAKGDSFDTAGYVREHLIEIGEVDRWDELEKKFIHESRSLNMLLPGAKELLTELHDRGEHYGILSYGNPLWQHLKITAAGFNHVHRIVTVNKEKGRLVSSWQQSDGTFKLPGEYGGGVASHIVMIDDKAISFKDFPAAPSQGYWVVNKENILSSQEGEVPENVVHCDDLIKVQQFL